MARKAKPADDKGPPPPPFARPEARAGMVGHAEALQFVRARIADGAFSNGWLLVGPDGVGKATFAFQAARALLNAEGDASAARRAAALISAGAHPDLFVARRAWNEKTQKYATEISVDTIRELTTFLTRTAAMDGWRVAIVDTADDLNRNAANALLKALEEPPRKSVLMLATARPGGLLSTIRSRCRRIDLRPASIGEAAAFLEREEAAQAGDAARLAEAARGRPGLALRLANGDGASAVAAVEDFLQASAAGRTPDSIARIAARGGEPAFELFEMLLLDRVATIARSAATAGIDRADVRNLIAAHDEARDLFARCAALNLDKAQSAHAVARIIGRAGVGRMAQELRAR